MIEHTAYNLETGRLLTNLRADYNCLNGYFKIVVTFALGLLATLIYVRWKYSSESYQNQF